MLYYQSGAVTTTGKRDSNQDNFLLNGTYSPEVHSDCCSEQTGKAQVALFAVADGMGGENGGERASFLVVKRLSEIGLADDARLPATVIQAVLEANDTLCAIMKQENTGRMGSTVVTLLIAKSVIYISNLGDSPAYLCRSNTIRKLTKDHTEGQAMLDGGVLTREQLLHHPSKNRLTRHLGIFPSELELEVAQYDLVIPEERDVFLLCSDGISGVFTDELLMRYLQQEKNAVEIAGDIVSEAIRLGSKDNCTALVVKLSRRPFVTIKAEKAVRLATTNDVKRASVKKSTTDDNQRQRSAATSGALPIVESIQEKWPGNKSERKIKRTRDVLLICIFVVIALLLAGVGYMFFSKHPTWQWPFSKPRDEIVNRFNK